MSFPIYGKSEWENSNCHTALNCQLKMVLLRQSLLPSKYDVFPQARGKRAVCYLLLNEVFWWPTRPTWPIIATGALERITLAAL